MKRFTRVLTLFVTLAVQGCMASTLVLHVMPDGSGQAVITTRMYESGIKAFDSMFPESPKQPPTLEEMLPPPAEGELEREFGTRVRIASTKVEKAADGGMRTTTVDFDDVTKLHLLFPPVFLSGVGMSGGFVGMSGLGDLPLITFSMKPHENGDRLLLVKMPDNRIQPDPNEPITSFATDSPEEQKFKLAIKNMAVRFFVELEQPLLRTNAPARQGNRATILDLDLDKLINNLDESKIRRAMSPGSMQEMLWQLGDLPGAVVPSEHEVFLEFEPPPAQAQPPAQPLPAAPQAPPDTEIYLAPMKTANGALEIGPAVNITNNPGYDNQPFFTPDGKSVLFTSVRRPATQSDIYRYDIAAKQIAQVTSTPESEYSPTVTPAGNISVIRVELDGNNTQRLWQFTPDGREPRLVLENMKPVGYHAWADDHTLALFVLGQPATLQLADTRTGAARIVASDIGRSMQRIPGSHPVRSISFVQRDRSADKTTLTIKQLNPSSGEITVLIPAVEGGTEADTAWTPDGTLLMARGTALYAWKRGQSAWTEVASLQRLSLSGVTRLAVSPRGDYLALVAAPREGR
jgi:hypothetical protein